MSSIEQGMRSQYLEEAVQLEDTLGMRIPHTITVPRNIVAELTDIATEQGYANARSLTASCDPTDSRLPHPDLIAYYAKQLEPFLPELLAQTTSLQGEPLVIRASPIDEAHVGLPVEKTENIWVEIARSRAHDNTRCRRKPHRRIDSTYANPPNIVASNR